eukprot:1157106-Pelagomonas_calceolata.AAC.3
MEWAWSFRASLVHLCESIPLKTKSIETNQSRNFTQHASNITRLKVRSGFEFKRLPLNLQQMSSCQGTEQSKGSKRGQVEDSYRSFGSDSSVKQHYINYTEHCNSIEKINFTVQIRPHTFKKGSQGNGRV